MSRSLTELLRSELSHKKVIFSTLFFALVYLLIAFSLPNRLLLWSTLTGDYNASYKHTLLLSILWGDIRMQSLFPLLLLILTALLVGCNLALFLKEIRRLRRQGTIGLTVGGGTLLGIAITGCSSCGFSLLSLLGLGASLSVIPFPEVTLRLIAIVLLTASTFYILKKLQREIACEVPVQRKD